MRMIITAAMILIAILVNLLSPKYFSLTKISTLSGVSVNNPCIGKSRCVVVSLSSLQSCCNCPKVDSFLNDLSSGTLKANVGLGIIFTDPVGQSEAKSLPQLTQMNSYSATMQSIHVTSWNYPTRAIWFIDDNFKILKVHPSIPTELNSQTLDRFKEELGPEYSNIFSK